MGRNICALHMIHSPPGRMNTLLFSPVPVNAVRNVPLKIFTTPNTSRSLAFVYVTTWLMMTVSVTAIVEPGTDPPSHVDGLVQSPSAIVTNVAALRLKQAVKKNTSNKLSLQGCFSR